MGIDKFRGHSTEDTELRRRAEDLIREVDPPDAQRSLAQDEALRHVHELQVQQTELNIQNSELRQTRDDLETALERYTDLYDFAPVGYFILDGGGIIRCVNLAGASFLGIERSLLIGRCFTQFVAQEARPAFASFLGNLFESRTKETCEVPLNKDGSCPLHVQIEALASESGKECRVAVIDITERRRAVDALAENRRELEESNLSLVQAMDELRRKDQMLTMHARHAAMGEMINNIAHQWRQPLNTLGLLIQHLPLCFDSGEFSREYLKETSAKAMKLIQHMSRTIDDFRNFFRSDKEIVNFGVNRIIEQTVSLVEMSLLDKKVKITLLADGDPIVHGYPNEYSQVILNILMNARDALSGNRIEDARISINSFAEGGTSVVTITDNAGGISDDVIEKLFDPYFTTKGPDIGAGIGLFMSKTIIEKNMGGKLTVYNTESGAEFRIEV